MLDFRVPCLLELKIPQMHFLKGQKKDKNASKNSPKNRGLKTAKNAEKSLKQRAYRASTPKSRPRETPKTDSKDPYIWARKPCMTSTSTPTITCAMYDLLLPSRSPHPMPWSYRFRQNPLLENPRPKMTEKSTLKSGPQMAPKLLKMPGNIGFHGDHFQNAGRGNPENPDSKNPDI
jgi:hypothetical protein